GLIRARRACLLPFVSVGVRCSMSQVRTSLSLRTGAYMRTGLPTLLCLLAACGTPADPSPDPGSSTPPATPNTSVVTVGGCQIFPADNAWNRDVSAEPVDPASNALLAQMSPDSALHLDLGTTEEYYGIPFVVVPQSQPLVPITYGT